jgi:hypothetical protein
MGGSMGGSMSAALAQALAQPLLHPDRIRSLIRCMGGPVTASPLRLSVRSRVAFFH